MIPIVIAIIATLVIVAPITWFISSNAINKRNDATIGNANEKAREIIDEALKTAETKKKEALLEVKEESLKTKNELEKETKERRASVQPHLAKRKISLHLKKQLKSSGTIILLLSQPLEMKDRGDKLLQFPEPARKLSQLVPRMAKISIQEEVQPVNV